MPWAAISLTNAGEFRVCSPSNSDKDTRGMLRDETGCQHHAATSSADDVKNAEILKTLRRDMLNGKQSSICVRCNKDDNHNSFSWRNIAKDKFPDLTLEVAESMTNDDGSVDNMNVRYVDVRLGNRCQLACRMCYPGDSTGWYREWYDEFYTGFRTPGQNRIPLKQLPSGKVVAGTKLTEWFEDSKFLKTLDKEAPNLESMHIVGGEPFLIEEHFDLLERLVESGRSKHVLLDYNTNAVSIPDRALNIWKNFKHVNLGISVDAVGEINDYIRYPSRFNKIDRNIDFLDQNAPDNISMWYTVTVQAMNIMNLPELFEHSYGKNYKKVNRNNNFMSLHSLNDPVYYKTSVLPENAKLAVEDIITHWFDETFVPYADKNGIDTNFVQSEINAYISKMNASDDTHLLPQFWEMTKKHDAYRNQCFEKTFPELAQYIIEYLDGINYDYGSYPPYRNTDNAEA